MTTGYVARKYRVQASGCAQACLRACDAPACGCNGKCRGSNSNSGNIQWPNDVPSQPTEMNRAMREVIG